VPALLTSASIRPYTDSVSSITRCTSSGWETSAATARIRPPARSTIFRVSSNCSCVLAAMATFAPATPNRRAIARPMPRPAPVTITALPLTQVSLLTLALPSAAGRTCVSGATRVGRPAPALVRTQRSHLEMTPLSRRPQARRATPVVLGNAPLHRVIVVGSPRPFERGPCPVNVPEAPGAGRMESPGRTRPGLDDAWRHPPSRRPLYAARQLNRLSCRERRSVLRGILRTSGSTATKARLGHAGDLPPTPLRTRRFQ